MKSKFFTALLMSALLFFFGCDDTPIGTVTPIVSLTVGNSPEGIIVNNQGDIFTSNTQGLDGKINQILHVKKDGSYTVFATLPAYGHARGLAVDKMNNLYVAFASPNKETNGVYRVNQQGTVKRLAESENIGSPNSLIFDCKGNLYATSSYGEGNNFEGAVWRYTKKEQVFKLLIKDTLLNGDGPPAQAITLPGANGIAFYPPNKLYVANTIKNSICCIKVAEKANESTIELVKQDYLLSSIDGIVIDACENIYGVLPNSTLGALGLPSVPPVIKLDVKTGIVSTVVEDNSYFDTPTSIAIGKGPGNLGSVFISNAALPYGQPPMAGPGVVKVKIVGGF